MLAKNLFLQWYCIELIVVGKQSHIRREEVCNNTLRFDITVCGTLITTTYRLNQLFIK